MVAHSGQKHLPEVFARLQGSGLKYYWTMALYHNVVDPFVGSGTTLVAAMELDRKTVGSEIDMDAYNIAKTRLSNKYLLKEKGVVV
jgi:hypothetical protein